MAEALPFAFENLRQRDKICYIDFFRVAEVLEATIINVTQKRETI
jgi:hypothetical protein